MNASSLARAAIFDVDGTLVDSNDAHIEAWRQAFGRYGKQLSYEQVHSQMGKGGDHLMPVFLSRAELDRFGEELEKFRGELFKREYLPHVEPFPKVRELFGRIKADGMRIALASSAKKEELEHHQQKLGVGALVDAATSADDAEHSKPSPDIFEAALTGLGGITAEAAIVIGDTPYDVQAAARAGMKTIALLSGGFNEKILRAQNPLRIYRDVADLFEHYDTSPLA